MAEDLKANVAGVFDRARERADEFRENVKDRASELVAKPVNEVWSDTRAYVRDNPGKSMLAALAAGVLLGTWMRRR